MSAPSPVPPTPPVPPVPPAPLPPSPPPSAPNKIDLWLTRAASLSQPLVLALAVFGYFYTVLPVYQKEVLSEQIAAKELELAKLQRQIDATGPTMTRLQSEASGLQRKILTLAEQSQEAATRNRSLQNQQRVLANMNSSLTSQVASKSAGLESAERAARTVALRAYHDSFSGSVSLYFVRGALTGVRDDLLSNPSYAAIAKHLATPYEAISATLDAGDSQYMPSNSKIPRDIKDAYHRYLRAFIEANKDTLSRPLSDVNALVFQIKGEMALAAVDPTPGDNFNERNHEIEIRLRSVISDSRSREMDRTLKVMSGLELDSLIGISNSR